MAKLHSFPRLHIGLLDLGHATHRDHGGAGFYVDGLPVEVEVVRSERMSFAGLDSLDEEGRNDLRSAVDRMRSLVGLPKLAIRLRNVIPQHVGLGSKTAVVLGVLKLLDSVLELDLGRNTLQKLSGRGGTSGVGVNAFFSGGFLADCGHRASGARRFAPSSRRSEFNVPPVVCRYRIPGDWRFHLVLLDGRRLASNEEVKFFQRNTPIPAREVLLSMAALYHGVAPAVLANDLRLLKQSLRELHSTGFKARELRNQTAVVKDFIREVDETTSLAVGMSSLGPLVYAVGTAIDNKGEELVKERALKYGGKLLGTFRGRNQGFGTVK